MVRKPGIDVNICLRCKATGACGVQAWHDNFSLHKSTGMYAPSAILTPFNNKQHVT